VPATTDFEDGFMDSFSVDIGTSNTSIQPVAFHPSDTALDVFQSPLTGSGRPPLATFGSGIQHVQHGVDMIGNGLHHQPYAFDDVCYSCLRVCHVQRSGKADKLDHSATLGRRLSPFPQ
jgi:hypothetical protein